MNVGKCIPRNGNVVFIDTTVSSGTEMVRENIAPTWEMVRSFKAGKLSEREYTDLYRDRLSHMTDVCRHRFERLALGENGITDIILGCYCAPGTFCHRLLLQTWLIDTFDFVRGWEVSREMVNTVEKPNGSVISITDSGMRTVDELRQILSKEMDAGHLRFVDRDNLGADFDLPAAESAYDQALTGFVSLSHLFRARSTDPHDKVTCVDVTYLAASMYDVGFLEKGGEYLMKANPTTTAGGLVGEHFNGQRGWHVIRITDDMSDDDVRKIIRHRGLQSVVTIGSS
jgi:uncharacterized protein YeaO (DUF488 family)